MNQTTKDKCPYCGGRGMKVLPSDGEVIVEGRRVSNESSALCICTLNTYVSDKFERLSGIGNVAGEDAISVAKTLPMRDTVLYGSEALFLYVVKCVIVMHIPYGMRFAVVTGADVAEKYAMAQPTGVIPTVDLLTPMDLVAMLCVAKVNNRAIGPGTQEVLANRERARKPTWIYAPDAASLAESKEMAAEEGRASPIEDIRRWPSHVLEDLFPKMDALRNAASRTAKRSQSIAADM